MELVGCGSPAIYRNTCIAQASGREDAGRGLVDSIVRDRPIRVAGSKINAADRGAACAEEIKDIVIVDEVTGVLSGSAGVCANSSNGLDGKTCSGRPDVV